MQLVDAHVHLWDPRRLRYSWQRGNALLDRPYLIEDYQKDTIGIDVQAMVFLECYADFSTDSGQYLEELEFVKEEAQRDPRLMAMVGMAPLEKGAVVAPLLESMVGRFPTLKGIRRIIEFEDDPRAFMMNPRFIEGVRLLKDFGLHFEINVNYTQMDSVLEFAGQLTDVPMILDHCGKPGIRGSHLRSFRAQMLGLSEHPNMLCKLSGLAVEANSSGWTEDEIRPYIETTIESFGVDRVVYGGDWPVCLQATTLQRWVRAVDSALNFLPEAARARIFRDNANRFYRLGLGN